MEQTRMFLAVVLSFLVFFLWNVFFVEKQEPRKKQPQDMAASQTAKEDIPPEKSLITDFDKEVPKKKVLTDEETIAPARTPRTIRIRSSYYTINISETNAVFKSFVLSEYRETNKDNSLLKELISKKNAVGTILFELLENSISGLDDAVYEADTDSDVIDATVTPQTVAFSWTSPRGIIVKKTYSFSPDTYLIGLAITIKNNSEQTLQDDLLLSLITSAPTDKRAYGFEGPCALINNRLEKIKVDKIEDQNTYSGNIKWVAFQNQFFMSGIIPENSPENSNDATLRLFLNSDKLVKTQYMQSMSPISPGTQHTFNYHLFLGPKNVNILKSFEYDLDKAVNFGWFDIIAKPCLWLMNFIYKFIPNYGIAIIILTIIFKILFWPLGTKSYKSMNEMKKLQPLMAELREKHKDDKKKMNEELMGLYKTYKVNPLGGCLPMVAQIPVFFAFYQMLYGAIELRHAPFFGWITDLSAPDRLFNFGFSIPFMEPPIGIPVLTIIMGGTMLLQQKMAPPAGDPAQAKIMMMMPIVFTFIFINFSSGLVLYWLVNNILSIAQQYYISKKYS
ncbi:MAG: membrane protein insertase YidC [Desulfobacterales bacterium]|nr:membrane protein insertase YidC [Desulfobacterales bacterium]